jgi:hypothetical protein
MMRAHNINLLAECVLFELYSHAIQNGGPMSIRGLLDRFRKSSVTSTILNFAIKNLRKRNFIVQVGTASGNLGCEITQEGYVYVRYRLSLSDSAISQYSSDANWLSRDEQPSDDAPEVKENYEEPVALKNKDDDIWEPLPVDREVQEFKEADEAVEIALSEIEGNNGYAESEPKERNHIVFSIREGLRQMREGLPSRAQVVANLIEPLKKIAKKFSDAAMGIAAKASVEKLLAWLGTFF